MENEIDLSKRSYIWPQEIPVIAEQVRRREAYLESVIAGWEAVAKQKDELIDRLLSRKGESNE